MHYLQKLLYNISKLRQWLSIDRVTVEHHILINQTSIEELSTFESWSIGSQSSYYWNLDIINFLSCFDTLWANFNRLIKCSEMLYQQHFYNKSKVASFYRLLPADKKVISVLIQIRTNRNLPSKICCENIVNIAMIAPLQKAQL